MSVTAFLNVRDRPDQTTGLFNVTFDIALSETTSDSNTITRQPVEFGADISDHNYANPRKWSMVYVVSNTPFVNVPIAPGASSQQLTRVRSAWEVLQRIRNTGQIFDLQSELEISSNVVIAALDVTQDKDTTEVLIANVTLEEIIITETELVEFPRDQLNPQVQKQAQSDTKGGLKQKKEVKNQSRLLQLANVFGFE